MSEDWEPPPGMRKLICASCGRAFATRDRGRVCASCKVPSLRASARQRSVSPFDTGGASGRGIRARIELEP